MRVYTYICVAFLCCLFGCGGGGGGGSSASIQISPGHPTVPLSGVQKFSAAVSGLSSSAVTWSVQEQEGGLILADGTYTAPINAGTYHVIATSVSNPSITASTTVTVPVGIDIDPPALTLTLGDFKSFLGTPHGTHVNGINWSIQEGAAGGSIVANGSRFGDYTAPNQPGIYHIIARPVADPSQSAVATVTVQAGGASGTIQ